MARVLELVVASCLLVIMCGVVPCADAAPSHHASPRPGGSTPEVEDPTLASLRAQYGENSEAGCMIKRMAWNFSRILLPERGNLPSVFDALQLGTVCNMTRPATLPPRRLWSRAGRAAPVHLPGLNGGSSARKAAPSAFQVFVDPVHGSNSNNGSVDAPLLTIDAALRVCRGRRTTVAPTIVLRGGTYYLNKTIVLGAEDSGTTLRNYPGEQPIISGGRVLTPVGWHTTKRLFQSAPGWNAIAGRGVVAGQSVPGIDYAGPTPSAASCQQACSAAQAQGRICTGYSWFDSGAGDLASVCYLLSDGSWNLVANSTATSGQWFNVWAADVTGQGGGKFTQLYDGLTRLIRARHPNGNPERSGLYSNPTGYIHAATAWQSPGEIPPHPVQIEIQSPLRNNSYFSQFGVGEHGSVYQFVPPVSYWGQVHPQGGHWYHVPKSLAYNATAAPALPWTNAEHGIVHAFHHGHWGNWQFLIDDMVPNNPGVGQVNVSWTYGGFQEARGDTNGKQFYFENVPELLDSPLEWYLESNATSGKDTLYFFPNGTASATPPATVVAPVLETVVAVLGESMEYPARNITVSGITFTQTISTFMAGYEVPSGGDWSSHRGGTVMLQNGEGLVVENCFFLRAGGNALLLSNYLRDTLVDGNEFLYPGDSAIVSLGTTELIDGTSGTQPRGTEISRNLAHEIGVWGKQTGALYQGLTAETYVHHNVFFNGPRAGINFNDGFGGGHRVEHNLIFNMVRETNDHGPFNSWDRQPYLSKVRNGTRSLIQKGSNITRNFIICNYRSVWPLDHDDGSCYYLDTYNFMVYGGFKNYLGHSKVAKNNIYAYVDTEDPGHQCVQSDGLGSLTVGWGDMWDNNTCICVQSQVYNYDLCCDRVTHTANNKLFTAAGNATVKCVPHLYTLEQYQQATGYDVGSSVTTWPSVAQVEAWGKEMLQFPADA